VSQQNPIARFWARISDGMALGQLWDQLRRESVSGYQLYAHEAAQRTPAIAGRRGRPRHLWREFLWAIVMKMSPARRILLVAAAVLLILGSGYALLGILILLGLLALEVADRVGMKRDLEIAREIQLWLLPARAPEIAGAEIAFTNLPANTVSGDFYDAFPRQGRVLFAVADVAGKGVPAAMLMATFQASLHTLAVEPHPLDSLIAALNRYASDASQGGTRFTTAFIAEFDPASRILRYSNAGHNPPLLRRFSGGGRIEKLESGGVPLGILAEAEHACAETVLAPGDVLVVYSDGLTESFDLQGGEYGEDRLIAAIERACAFQTNPPAAVLLQTVVADCERFRGGVRQQDDLTCLVLRLLP